LAVKRNNKGRAKDAALVVSIIMQMRIAQYGASIKPSSGGSERTVCPKHPHPVIFDLGSAE